ncbi:MAG: T9SS type A sorting domain-containing protein [Bacteroidetes bacterium]|nr:T9SS type A sorting domain-containing protein [Bacteroidota bacterium]
MIPYSQSRIFSISSTTQKQANLDIYDVKGRKVYSGNWNGSKQDYQLDLPNGMYFVRMQSGKSLDVKKFIIERK